MQAGLLYETLSGRSGAYVQQLTIACEEPLDAGALDRAWRSLLRRHGALRTSFTIGESATALQHVHEEVALAVTIVDWRGLDAQEQRVALAGAAAGRTPRRGSSRDRRR